MMKITTVCGDISPEQLGFASMHEHTLVNMAPVFGAFVKDAPTPTLTLENVSELKQNGTWRALREELHYDDTELETQELKTFKRFGGNAILDCGMIGLRGDPRKVKEMSEQSEVNIVMCTGFGDFSDSYINKQMSGAGQAVSDSEGQGTATVFDPFDQARMRDVMLKEIHEGMDGTDIRPGAVKAILYSFSEREKSILRAACRVAAETEYPITVHCPVTTEAVLGIIDIALNECGVKPEKFNLSHLDKYFGIKEYNPSFLEYVSNPNQTVKNAVDFSKRILDMGINCSIDNVGSFLVKDFFDVGIMWCVDDYLRLSVMVPLLEQGYAGQLMLGHDKAGRVFNFNAGSYGYTRVINFIVPALKHMGFQKEADMLCFDTPAKFLSHN